MRRRDILAASAVLAASASAAHASGAPAKGAPVGQYVDLSPVAVPSMEGRRLKNYIFCAVRLKLTPRADSQALRDKEPYFRDAIVRAAHRTAFNLPTDYDRLDEARFKAVMLQEAARIAGPGLIAGVQFTSPPQAQRRTRRPG
ncbi:MAG: hypothetical protein K1X35_02060 [Caulobacteraceae bacterium]|nr:hypothetical protein [Caulobacteraceae bacterium]